MRFTLYPIEPSKKSGTANTIEGYNTDNLPMEYDLSSYVVGHVNVGQSQIQFFYNII